MKSTDINRYPIREYLAGLNIYPAKDKGYYGMYHSPFREDSNASMKVDYDKNLWIDYGSNEGGTLIDLAGVHAMLLFSTVSAFIGALIVLIFAERTSK